MDISKAIEWASGVFYDEKEPTKTQKEVIECLKEGKAYKAIVEEIEKELGGNAGFMQEIIVTKKSFNIIKQKHLSKPEELSSLVNVIKVVINKSGFTCEEIANRLIPKD